MIVIMDNEVWMFFWAAYLSGGTIAIVTMTLAYRLRDQVRKRLSRNAT